MELLHGSPADLRGRSAREIKAYEFLDRLGVEFDRTDHPETPATTMEVCAEVDAILGVHICKNLFLCNRQKTAFYLLMMPGRKAFRTKELSAQIHSSRLSFAEPEYLLRYLDTEPGAVSVMGLMNDRGNDVRLLIDEDVLKDEFIGCHPCVSTSSLKLKTKDLTERFLPATGHPFQTVQLKGKEE